MKTARLATLVTLAAFSGSAFAAPHSISYSQVSVAPGTQVTIAGKNYIAVQVPMRQFTIDKRYAVRFLAEDFGQGSVFASLQTEHSTDDLPSPNATIDGFPAQIDVSDGRRYSLQGDASGSTLEVTGDAFAFVRVKVGDTVVTFLANLSQMDQQVAIATDPYRGTSQAAYGRYTDPVSLVGTAGLDKWLDYIRIIPLN